MDPTSLEQSGHCPWSTNLTDYNTCHARGCIERISNFKLMCHEHWLLVPGWIKRKMRAFRQDGVIVDLQKRHEYARAVGEAIKWVDKMENKKGD